MLHTSLSRLLCIFCASIMLVGCSYFDTSGHDELQVSKSAQDIEVLDQSEYALQPVSAAEAISRSTNGRVQVFDLDAPAPQASYVAPLSSDIQSVPAAPVAPVVQARPAARVFSADPSVEVFPFEDFVPSVSAVQPMQANPPPPVEQPVRAEEDYVAVAGHNGDKVIVYFDHDSAVLSQVALGQVSSVAGQFNQASGKGVTVEGHSSVKANYNDAAQRKVVNLKISMDRAFAVARSLIQSGVPAEFIRVMAWGDTHPPLQTDGKTAEDAARRVEISR